MDTFYILAYLAGAHYATRHVGISHHAVTLFSKVACKMCCRVVVNQCECAHTHMHARSRDKSVS